jgi:histidinol dehydrogenase
MQIEDLRNSAWRFNSRLRFVMARGEVMAEEYEPAVIAQKSLERFGTIFLVEDLEQACEVANYIAPEHLELMVEEPFALLPKIQNPWEIISLDQTIHCPQGVLLSFSHPLEFMTF